MSLQPQPIAPVPEETDRLARATIRRVRQELGVLYDDALCAPLFCRRGQPVEAP